MEATEDSGFASNTNSCVSLDGNLDATDIITDNMVKEETMLEAKVKKKEKNAQDQMLQQEKHMEEQCYKRLHLLLSRSSIYAKFITDKLKRDDLKEAKRQSKLEKQKENFDISKKNSNKRKNVDQASPKKRQKAGISVIDAYRKESGKHLGENDKNEEILNSSATNPLDDLSKRQPELITGAVMHPYQIDGFEWLKVLFENGVNGILADEMGLGKTIQSIAFIAHLIQMGILGPFFVCGPLSTVPNWCLEIKKFAPSIPVMVYHGNFEERKALRKKILKKVQNKDVCCYPIVVTSYSIALIDAKLLRNYDWKLLVIDEAHRIKNFQCQLVCALKTYNVSHRLLLTGTPLQNNLAELWSLLNFILPEIFDDLKVFESWFDVTRLTEKSGAADIVAKEQEKQIISIIHEILAPFLLRRTKAEVQLKLPQKKEVVVYAPFTPLQRQYYTAALNKTISNVLHGTTDPKETVNVIDSGRPKRHKNTDFTKIWEKYEDDNFEENAEELILSLNQNGKVVSSKGMEDLFADIKLNTRNISMLLRKICNHPYLISHPLDVSGSYKIDEGLVKNSGKLLLLDMLLPELRKRGHKVVLFSQFVSTLDLLQDYCDYRKYPYSMLCGRMKLGEREEEIKEFKSAKDSFIFLISTRAGGLGINLADADTVILYDSDWNPQGDLQAQDRCHRIGQEKPVVVYRLIIPNTVDEAIFNRANAKRKLEKVIIKEGRFNSKHTDNNQLSIAELMRLLQSCESNGVVQTNDENVLSPEEFERILDRSDIM